MAKNIVKKNTISIKAIVTIEGDRTMIQTEDMDEPIPLATFIIDFDGQEVSLNINQSSEL